MKKKFVFRIILALFFCVAVTCAGPARAAIIEPDPDLQRVMGDLYALSVAMRLYYDDTRNTQCPDQNDLARYLKKPLPDDWPAGYRTFVIQNDWWAGRKIPEFSAARKFLRENAPLLGLYDQTSRSAWLGGEFVWINALSFKEEPENPVFKVAPGEGDDSLYLFFNSPGTDYYWRSGLIYTDEARAEALRKFGTDAKGPFVVPAAPSPAPENLSASPVETPPDFTLSGEELDMEVKVGDVIFNPIPRQRER